MFVTGEINGCVKNGKLALPKEFHLRKKRVIGKWRDEFTLYLSDNNKSLNFAAGNNNGCFLINLDSDDRIEIPEKYENYNVEIKGCISTVELVFRRR